MDKRKAKRRELDDLAARIFLILPTGAREELEYFPINVSQRGFSIFTSVQLRVGALVTLELSSGPIHLTVVWCRSKENDLAQFRCGLEARDGDAAIDELIKAELTF